MALRFWPAWLWRGVGVLAMLLAAVHAWAGNLQAGEPQEFVFKPKGFFADKPVKVYYYKARSAGPNAQVLIAMHGFERNGNGARDHWMAVAEQQQLIVLAPLLDEANYPHRLFQMAGMEDTNPSRWTFNVLEQLFEQVKADEGLSTTSYLLFGHSAGAQFVHRMALAMPQSHASTIVAANAGAYMVPAYSQNKRDLRYPWALDENVVSLRDFKAALGRKLIVLLGEADTKTSAADFPKSREASYFGETRLERGKNFYAAAHAQADKLGTPFGWELHTVPDVGHSSKPMAKAAAQWLFPTKKAATS